MSAGDQELIERSRNGDYSAFEQLLLRYDRDVLSIAARYAHDADDAKDIYQETFIRVYKGLSNFRGDCSFPTWVYRIAVNVCLTHRRRQRRRATVPLEAGDEGNEPAGRERTDERAEGSETLRRIHEAMENLSPQQRLAFSLKHHHERSIREIAEMMECEEGTVKRYLFDATRRMRERLQDLVDDAMNDHELDELLHLAAMNELSPEQERSLESRLRRNPAARKELEELKRLGALVAGNAPAPLPESVLSDARRGLRQHLSVSSRSALLGRFRAMVREWLPPRFAVTGSAALALGVLIGYCSFNLPEGPALSIQPASETQENTAARIENLRFIDQDGSDGEVEFEFDAVAPVRLKGRIDDPEVQRILTHAMLNESNPGVRLSSMQTIAQEAERNTAVDTAVVSALLAALAGDVNPGVRREALRVLQQMPFSPRIRDAFVSVVIHDRNSGLRVAAINALELARLDGNAIDRQNAESLRRRLESESNHYIRERAAHLVKEVYQ